MFAADSQYCAVTKISHCGAALCCDCIVVWNLESYIYFSQAQVSTETYFIRDRCQIFLKLLKTKNCVKINNKYKLFGHKNSINFAVDDNELNL